MGMHEVVNTAMRRLDNMFPGYFNTTTKRNHYVDFGYPERLSFAQLWQMYQRNGFANAAIEKTLLKVWEDDPVLHVGDEPGETTPAEQELIDRFTELRFWQHIAEADRRSMVGKYGALILRVADSKLMKEPVDTVPGGLDGLVELIPCWEGQLEVSNWDTDERSETYGHPTMFSFNEAAFDANQGKTRSFEVHPDRVIIWSRDATVYGTSRLEPGYNDLVSLEKVLGAGGEGFWKNAKSAPVLHIDKEARLEDMAKAMGVAPDELADKMDEQVTEFQKGFDALLMLQGMKADTLGVTLPDPKEFRLGPLESFAASFNIPLKILIGSQTGERASTEDASEWAKTCNARRNSVVKPNIMMLVLRLVRFGILREAPWAINWADLTEASMKEKIDRADKMSGINQKNTAAGGVDLVFTENEIRETVGLQPLEFADRDEDEGDEE